MTDTQNTSNFSGAIFSFLRVLTVAEASALFPLFFDKAEYPTLEAMGLAAVPAFLLTVINYFRSGETRFGPPPNPGARNEDDEDLGV